MARENLQADIAAMRANLQQLSRELAYHRSAPDVAHSGQLDLNEVGIAPKGSYLGSLHLHISTDEVSSKGPSLVEEKLADMCTKSIPAEKERIPSEESIPKQLHAWDSFDVSTEHGPG